MDEIITILGVGGIGVLSWLFLWKAAKRANRQYEINKYYKNWEHYRPQDVPEGAESPLDYPLQAGRPTK